MNPCYLEQQGFPRCDPINDVPGELCSDCLENAYAHALDTIRAIDVVVRHFMATLPIGRSLLSHTRPWLPDEEGT